MSFGRARIGFVGVWIAPVPDVVVVFVVFASSGRGLFIVLIGCLCAGEWCATYGVSCD
jgi:hypothetical protein